MIQSGFYVFFVKRIKNVGDGGVIFIVDVRRPSIRIGKRD